MGWKEGMMWEELAKGNHIKNILYKKLFSIKEENGSTYTTPKLEFFNCSNVDCTTILSPEFEEKYVI